MAKKFTSAKTESSRACFVFFVIEYLCSFAGTAVSIRGDRGTENLKIEIAKVLCLDILLQTR